MDEDLMEAAMQRAAEISLWFEHTRLTGESALDISPKAWGENISAGQGGPEWVMNSWMNSEGHRNNILNDSYASIGVGCFEIDDSKYWVQLFGIESTDEAKQPADAQVDRTVNIVRDIHDVELRLLPVSGSNEPLQVGRSRTYSAYCTNTGYAYICISNKCLAWLSLDDSIASVNQQGVVVGKKSGAATVVARTSGGLAPQTTVTVNPVSIFAVSLSTAKVVYDGSVVRPRVSAMYEGASLAEGVDFKLDKIAYNLGDGLGMVVVKGMGGFEGMIEIPFEVSVPGPLRFVDVPSSSWFFESTAFAKAHGLISGYENSGLFGPTDTLTRAQAAVILWRYFAPEENEAYNVAEAVNATGLADVEDGAFYTGAANWAVMNKVINGVDDGGVRTFDPEGEITREQFCAIMGNAAVSFCGDVVESADQSKLLTMPDASEVSPWAPDSVAWGLNKGMINGVDEADGRYVRPGLGVDRATMAAVMMNAIQKEVLK